MTHSFFVTTYNFPYLRISLPSIQRYVKQNTNNSFNLLISSDNPNLKLTEEYVSKFIDLSLFNKVVILNTDENLGCFYHRIKCIKRGYEEFQDCKYFMFIDDDDIILNPSFDSDKVGVIYRSVITHRLLEVLNLINDPTIDLNNKNFEYQEWKIGCVGNAFNLKEYYRFICDTEDWFPTLNDIYGSKKIMSPDDYMLHHLWAIWLSYKYMNDIPEHDHIDTYAYSLTYLEDRIGRYEIDDNSYDFRYRDDYSRVHEFYVKVHESFDKYIIYKLNLPIDTPQIWKNILQ